MTRRNTHRQLANLNAAGAGFKTEKTPILLHTARQILAAAKQPEDFSLNRDPVDGTPLTNPEMTDKQKADLDRFNAKFPAQPKLNITPSGKITRRKGKPC